MSRVIVLLGCRATRLTAATAAGRRVDAAARAWRPGSLVIASGGRRWRGIAEADAMTEGLVARGVPRGAVVRELISLSTRENAQRSAHLLRLLGAEDVLVATCDWHLPRALREFAAAGVVATGVPAPSPPVSHVRAAWRTVREWCAG